MTSTKILTQHTQGKVIQLDYDFITNLDDDYCLYCLSDKHVQMILALSDFYGWSTRWYSDDGLLDEDVILSLQGGLVKALMNGCCGDGIPTQFRWGEDGELEKSEDGGVTWTPAPEYDPRQNSTRFPEPTGGEPDDLKCIAATGMIVLMKEQVRDQLTDDMSRYTLSQVITDWIATLISTSNPFLALIQIAVNQIFALIIAVLRPALTDEVFNTLLCIFFCNMSDDISFTGAQVEQVTTDVGEQISGIATLFFQQLINLLGEVGMTNLARAGGATEGDCDGCGCGEGCSIGNWVVYDATAGTINTATRTDTFVEITAQMRGDGNYYIIFISDGADNCCTLDIDGSESSMIKVISGSPTLSVNGICGNAPADIVSVNSPLTYGTTTLNGILYRGSSVFVLEINTAP